MFTFLFPSECMNTELNASNGEHAAKLFVLKIICLTILSVIQTIHHQIGLTNK
jgi:hypothetical protein